MRHPGISNAAALERRRAILAAYCLGEKVEVIAARLGVSDRLVRKYAADARVQRKPGRPQVWPECPDHLRDDYRRLTFHVGADEARRALENAP